MNAAVSNYLRTLEQPVLTALRDERGIPQIGSFVARFDHFISPWYRRWAPHLEHARGDDPTYPRYHRKDWEWIATSQALLERGALGDGKCGLGFAVGTEPLASLFAGMGSDIIASDAPESIGIGAGWASTNQHARSLSAIYRPALVSRADFDARVAFVPADMAGTLPFAAGTFDFIWSCCALEHLGSLDAGASFILRSAKLLRPGGIAVHTTEYNVSSNDATIDRGDFVIYRRCDIERIDGLLRREGYCLEGLDFTPGDHEVDRRFDQPPFYSDASRQHVKLLLGNFVSTSMLLIVRA